MRITTLLLGLLTGSFLATTVFGADVKENWEKHCQKCHGPDGKGNTRMGRQSGVKDYTDPKVQAEMTDDKAVKVIKEGIPTKVLVLSSYSDDEYVHQLTEAGAAGYAAIEPFMGLTPFPEVV